GQAPGRRSGLGVSAAVVFVVAEGGRGPAVGVLGGGTGLVLAAGSAVKLLAVGQAPGRRSGLGVSAAVVFVVAEGGRGPAVGVLGAGASVGSPVKLLPSSQFVLEIAAVVPAELGAIVMFL
ncbi:hypothetical protein, partial [Streptomyces sp. NPDC058294]|uniref:hypothetical protein n=1 Tax=Streptomyces sp. NPDC058294 TaxID=3346430 RepID=UPI0036E66494